MDGGGRISGILFEPAGSLLDCLGVDEKVTVGGLLIVALLESY